MKNSFLAKFGLMFGFVSLLFLAGCDCKHKVRVVREVREVVREVPQPIRPPLPTVDYNCFPRRFPNTCRPQLNCVPMPVYRCGRIWVPVRVPVQVAAPFRHHRVTVFRGY